MDAKDKKLAALTGAGSAALFSLKGLEQDFHDRLRTLRADERDTHVRLNHLLASGDWLRLEQPMVRDALTGIAAATPRAKAPSVAPAPWTAASRPDLTREETIAGLSWPPPVGRYDTTGRAQSPGQLAQTFYALTYEEPRIALQALTQREPPSGEAKRQLFFAFQALSRAITGRSFTAAEWEEVWTQLFDGVPQTKAPLNVSFTGATQDAVPKIVGEFKTEKDGIYTVHAVCGIQRDDGAGGSLTVFATYSKFKGALSLVRSARLNAQLSSVIVGVDTTFDTREDQIQLSVIGKPTMNLSWDNHVTIYTPT